jgi:hypothetical protein
MRKWQCSLLRTNHHSGWDKFVERAYRELSDEEQRHAAKAAIVAVTAAAAAPPMETVDSPMGLVNADPDGDSSGSSISSHAELRAMDEDAESADGDLAIQNTSRHGSGSPVDAAGSVSAQLCPPAEEMEDVMPSSSSPVHELA